jgi:1-acyl-sn-glycerol-3-phosphate acyltransferase
MLAHVELSRDGRRAAVRDAWTRRWAHALLALFSIEVVTVGAAPPRAPVAGARGRLVVANHRSAIDIGVLLATLGGTMVSRADLAGWPLVGRAARAVGTVFVDRKNAESGAATIRTIQKHLEAGKTIAIFPEGTTFDGDEVRPFFAGGFIAATRAGAEVLPVGLAYPRGSGAAFVDETFPQHLARMAASDATRMAIAIGAPFVAGKELRARDVTARAHAEVEALVQHARERCGP